jgi:hypothetical protein
MKHMNIDRILSVAVLTGGAIVAASALADPAQGADGSGMGSTGMGSGMGSGMMNGYGGGWMGGYGGIWVTVLLVIVVAGLVAWVVRQKRK